MKYENLPRICPNCGQKMYFIGWDCDVCLFKCSNCGGILGD